MGSVTFLPLYLQVVKGSITFRRRDATAATDGGAAGQFDCQWPDYQPHWPLSAVPDFRHVSQLYRHADAGQSHAQHNVTHSFIFISALLGFGLGMVMQVSGAGGAELRYR